MTETGPWLTRVNLLLTQAPGVIPSVLRIKAGDMFYLDGGEGIDLDMAQRLGQIVPYEPGELPPELLQEPTPEPRKRRVRKATE